MLASRFHTCVSVRNLLENGCRNGSKPGWLTLRQVLAQGNQAKNHPQNSQTASSLYCILCCDRKMKRRAYVNTKTSTLQHVLEASWNVRRFGLLELQRK